jgi:hypothetical protein
MTETETAAATFGIQPTGRRSVDLATFLWQSRILSALTGLVVYSMGRFLLSRATVALFKAAIKETYDIERVRIMARANGILSLVLLVTLLPAVYLFLLRRKCDAAAADIALVRVLTVTLAVGALIMLCLSSRQWPLHSRK